MRDLVLVHRVDLGGYGFHVRTYFLTKHFEVRLDLLDKTNLRLLGRDDDEFLDVHLGFDEVSNMEQGIGSLLIGRRDDSFL